MCKLGDFPAQNENYNLLICSVGELSSTMTVRCSLMTARLHKFTVVEFHCCAV